MRTDSFMLMIAIEDKECRCVATSNMEGLLLLSDQEDFKIVMFVNEQVDTMYEIDENTRNT